MELTKKRAITLHRRMWRWIGLKTLKEKRCVNKSEWFAKFGGAVRSDCYCCEYASAPCFVGLPCYECCPIDWGGLNCLDKVIQCDNLGLYSRWCGTFRNDYQEAAELALQISALPERED